MFKLNFHNLDCAMTGAQIDIFQKYSIRVTYFRVDYYLQFYIIINHDYYKAFKFRSPSAYVGKTGRRKIVLNGPGQL